MDDVYARLGVDPSQVGEFCRKWKIVRMELFGSVLREDFDEQSDIDVLVTFAPDARVGMFDLVHMEDELRETFSRDVDLVMRKSIEESPTWIRRRAILGGATPIYASA